MIIGSQTPASDDDRHKEVGKVLSGQLFPTVLED